MGKHDGDVPVARGGESEPVGVFHLGKCHYWNREFVDVYHLCSASSGMGSHFDLSLHVDVGVLAAGSCIQHHLEILVAH